MRVVTLIKLVVIGFAFFVSACSSNNKVVDEDNRFRVRVSTERAQWVEQEVQASAKTLPSRTVTLKAQTKGTVISIEAGRGCFLKRGERVVFIDPEDRVAQLEEAQSLVNQKLLEYSASVDLHKKGYEADSKLAAAQTALDQAKAKEDAILLDIKHTAISAPFDGFLDKRPIEEGDYLSIGTEVGTFVELDPLKVVGYVSGQEVLPLKIGMPGYALFLDGTRLEGALSYVAKESRENVRTFAVELTVSNPKNNILSGMSAQLIIPFRSVLAHKVPMSTITLDSEGNFGVKAVNEFDEVVFYPANIVRSDAHYLWIEGLPEQARIIVLGQGFVREGERVIPVEDPMPVPL